MPGAGRAQLVNDKKDVPVGALTDTVVLAEALPPAPVQVRL